MVTKINIPIDLKKESVGIITEDIADVIVSGDYVKLFIPTIMSGIIKGTPKTEKVYSKGNEVFINDKKCRPKAKKFLTQQNYIETRLANNSDSSCLYEGDIIPKGTKVQTVFVNGKLKSPLFNTNNY